MQAALRNSLHTLGQLGSFTAEILHGFLQPPVYRSEIVLNSRKVAFQCILPVVAILFPTGMISALMGLKIMALFGTERMLSSLLAQGIVKEMAPSLAGIMIASQAGSAIAGEIGTMRVKEEIDALGVMAINPIKYLVIPRLIALAFVCPLIAVIATASGMLGGFTVAVLLKGQNMGVFIANLLAFVTLADIYAGLLKAAVFGVAVGLIACFYGYHVSGGAVGVGKAANNTVVHSIVAVAVLNYLLTTFLMRVLGV
ncbi:MAG: ABC transporter permease [Candidatus Sericytochromatia bacterium]|nr:ABC transporter permease [Candidatus Sericytochromatia bacterium]